MKKQLSIILGALSVCCFVSAHVMASEKTVDENSLKTRAISCKKSFTPAHATIIQATTSGWISTAQMTVPFEALQTAKNITFDPTNLTFTLPKGVYTFDFQFTMERQGPANIIHELDFRFTDMYLDIDNDTSRIALDWNLGFNSDLGFNSYVWAIFSGSKIISIGADNTVVKFILVRDAGYKGNIRFTYNPSTTPTLTTENNPVRISIHKIDGCEYIS